MLLRLLIVCLLLLAPSSLIAQQQPNDRKSDRTRAVEELEAVIIEARNLDNKSAMVSVKSRAAMLVWFSDPARAESIFLDVWKFVNAQSDSDFDKQQARLVILKYLFPKNPKLARQLLSEKTTPDNRASESKPTDNSERQATRLANQLIEADPAAAASLLEKSLTTSPTNAGVGALAQLREKDSFLSDYVAAKTLDSLTVQPTLVSLPALQLMTAYAFPGPATVMSSNAAESSLEALQFKYFLVGYDLLKASLGETNEFLLKQQHLTNRDVQFRAANQAMIAAILAALAPRFQPAFAVELRDIAARLAPQMPPNISQLTQLGLAKLSGNPLTSEDAETSFTYALSYGDFDEARKQLDRISDAKKRELYGQVLIKSQARTLLRRGDVLEAVALIRKLEDETTRLVMYLEAVKSANRKRDTDLTRIIIDEAKLLIPQTGRNGLHIQALLSFIPLLTDPASVDDAFEFLGNAVISINALSKKSKPEGPSSSPAEMAMAELNDPQNLFEAPEMEQAFSALGLRDLDRALVQARNIDLRSLQLTARLETIQGVIKSPRPKAKAAPKTAGA
jgi:hypothetical protein